MIQPCVLTEAQQRAIQKALNLNLSNDDARAATAYIVHATTFYPTLVRALKDMAYPPARAILKEVGEE